MTSKRHILVLSPSADMYGSDRALLNALPELADAFRVTLAFASEGPFVEHARSLGVETIVTPDFALRRRLLSPMALVAWVFRVARTIRILHARHRGDRFDLVYSNTLATFVGPFIAWMWKLPHVEHAHECPLEPRRLTALLVRMLRGSKVIICNSEYTRGLICQLEPRLSYQAVVVYNGIEFPEPLPRRELQANGRMRISFVARIHPKKGHAVMLEALALARAEGFEWELDCFGDALSEHEMLASELRALSEKLGVADLITWRGFVEGTDRYAGFDAAVVPSVWPEEFSLVAAESQAMGLPAVVTGPGGASEVIEHGTTGFVVGPRDPQALFDALRVLDEDRELAAEMGRAGQARMLDRFARGPYARRVVEQIDLAVTPMGLRSWQTDTQRRPRLLVVAPSAELYGSDRSLLNLLPELTESFDVTIAYAGDGPAADLARHAGAEAFTLPDFAFRRANLRGPEGVAWLRRRRRAREMLDALHRANPFDLVYSNTLAAGLGHMLTRRWRVPGVVHIRECPPKPLWQLRALLRLVARGSDLVICNSYYTEGLVLQYGPYLRGRSVVIHNGIPLPEPSAAAGVAASGPFRLSCVGRIHPKKGQGVLIEAARLAKKDGRDWQLHFFGDALPQHQDLLAELKRAVAEAGLADAVHWRGFVASDARYEGVDAAVVPSVYPEEFSLVCVEAQSMRLPVVATGPGGPSEIIVEGETGFIVPPEDAEALYAALAVLDDDRERARAMGARGRERMLQHFSRETYARAVRDTLLDVLPGSRRGPGRTVASRS